MSNRSITENLEYFVSNTGLHYNYDAVLELVGTGPATLNGQAITTGTVTSSSSINVGTTPGRILTAYWPRFYELTKSFALVANTPQILDWTAASNTINSFALFISPGTFSTFLQVRAAQPTQWEVLKMAHYVFSINGVPTVTLGDGQTLKVIAEISFDAGVSWRIIQSFYPTKIALSSTTVDHIGGASHHFYADGSTAPGDVRIRFTATSTENKTVSFRANFGVLNTFN